MKLYCKEALLITLGIVATTVLAENYKVNEQGHNLEVTTPWGARTLIGDFGLANSPHYRVDIPLSRFKPPEPEKATARDPAFLPYPWASQQPQQPQATEIVEETETIIEEPESKKKEEKSKQPDDKTQLVEYDDTDKLIVEANYLYNMGHFYESLKYVDEALRKKPTLVRAWIMKGSLLYVQGHKDLAKKAWGQASTLEPENKDIQSIIERFQ